MGILNYGGQEAEYMMLPDFKIGMDKLEAVFRPITDEQRDIYWDRLQSLAPKSFRNAIDYVIDVHKDKTFPTVAEILEATGHVSTFASSGLPEATGVKCSTCNDMGYILTLHADTQPSACPCGCKLGETIKEGWINSFKRGKK